MNDSTTKLWNKCSICGKFIPFEGFDSEKARRTCISVDSDYSTEEYENFCRDCNKKEP